MRLLVLRSKWDFPDEPLAAFLRRIKSAGFDGSDLHLPSIPEPPETVRAIHDELGLALVAMITTEGSSPADHLRWLDEWFERAARLRPLLVNCHTGRDTFAPSDNAAIFRRSIELSARSGIPVAHETHRGRALFSAPAARELLTALPEMRITADFSHWCCVHESLLADQEETMRLAVDRSAYVHARVGHAEGPQVSDPRAPEWEAEVRAHVGWWRAIAGAHRARGSAALAVCPEFGPAPYMPSLPHTRQPVGNLWEITLWMQSLLRAELGELATPQPRTP